MNRQNVDESLLFINRLPPCVCKSSMNVAHHNCQNNVHFVLSQLSANSTALQLFCWNSFLSSLFGCWNTCANFNGCRYLLQINTQQFTHRVTYHADNERFAIVSRIVTTDESQFRVQLWFIGRRCGFVPGSFWSHNTHTAPIFLLIFCIT